MGYWGITSLAFKLAVLSKASVIRERFKKQKMQKDSICKNELQAVKGG